MNSYHSLLALASLAAWTGSATASGPADSGPQAGQLSAGSNQAEDDAPPPARTAPEMDASEMPADAALDDLLRYAAEHSPEMRAAFERPSRRAGCSPTMKSEIPIYLGEAMVDRGEILGVLDPEDAEG